MHYRIVRYHYCLIQVLRTLFTLLELEASYVATSLVSFAPIVLTIMSVL